MKKRQYIESSSDVGNIALSKKRKYDYRSDSSTHVNQSNIFSNAQKLDSNSSQSSDCIKSASLSPEKRKLTDFNEENFNIEENADAFENAATDALETVVNINEHTSSNLTDLQYTSSQKNLNETINYSRKDLRQDLAKWAIDSNVPHSKLKNLLTLLNLYEHNLPSDQRTLLSTPRKCPINICEFGEYKYFGVESSLEKILEKNRIEFLPTELSLTLCIDDVPINKEVSITATFNIEMSKFIADTVAKSKILKIKGHTGYLRCTKCWVHGELKNNRLYFKDTRAKKRTDEEAKMTSTSVLKNIRNFSFVTKVPLDYMHLVCLGVVKTLLMFFVFGGKNKYLGKLIIEKINFNIEQTKSFTPSEFVRKPNFLNRLHYWKATQLRQFP